MKERGNEKAYSIINVTKVNIHEYITFSNRDNQSKPIYGQYKRRDKPFRLVPLTKSRVNAQESHFAAPACVTWAKSNTSHGSNVSCMGSLIHFLERAASDFVPTKGPCYISVYLRLDFDPGACLCNGSFHIQEPSLSLAERCFWLARARGDQNEPENPYTLNTACHNNRTSNRSHKGIALMHGKFTQVYGVRKGEIVP